MIPSPTTVPLLCKRLVIRGGGGDDRVTMTELLSMAMVDSYFECHSVSFRRPSESSGYTFTPLICKQSDASSLSANITLHCKHI